MWGQIIVVFSIVLVAVWGATQWTAWRLGFQAQLGNPWFELGGLPVDMQCARPPRPICHVAP